MTEFIPLLDDEPARRLRGTTRNLLAATWADEWPRDGAIVDFGLRTQEHYEALYYPLRHGDITPEQVDAAMGDGGRLTDLVSEAAHNPHKGIVFRTDRDDLRPEPEQHEGDSTPLPSPGQIAAADRQQSSIGVASEYAVDPAESQKYKSPPDTIELARTTMRNMRAASRRTRTLISPPSTPRWIGMA